MSIKETIKKRNKQIRLSAERAAINAVAEVGVDVLCAPPQLKNAKRVLFVQPHPDDNHIGAGGTMAWLVSLGV